VFFKERLSSGDLLRGVAHVIPSAVATQAVAAAGVDFVMIDREHGPIGRENLHAMVTATAGTDCAPLVRVPAIDEERSSSRWMPVPRASCFRWCARRRMPSVASRS
jgi:2-keto-3-deoxy-L-rhamnonate aldolase RhmA